MKHLTKYSSRRFNGCKSMRYLERDKAGRGRDRKTPINIHTFFHCIVIGYPCLVLFVAHEKVKHPVDN